MRDRGVEVVRVADRVEVRRGTSAAGMDHASWGDGPLTTVYLGGGPGGSVPEGRLSSSTQRWFEPFTEAGHTVWYLSRRRNLPRGHTVEDMADDVAGFVTEQLGGRADLVVGVSFGGMVALHLAARHPEVLGRVGVIAAAAEVSAFGKDVDARLAAALDRGERAGAGAVFGEYVLPGRRWAWLRRLAGPLVGRMVAGASQYPPSDVVVEAEAELTYDARAALPRITVPVVLLCGDEDRFFTTDVVEETVRLVPGCRVVRYPGRGHLWVASSRTVPHDLLRALEGP